MNTLRQVLLNNSVKPSGQGWVLPVSGGTRFVLTETYNVIDKGDGDKMYVRDTSIPLATAMFNIPNLTTGATNIAYLFAHAVKPIVGLTDAQFKANTNFKPFFLNNGLTKDSFVADDVFWDVPDGGVELTTDHLLIPGFGKYYVDKADWKIKHVTGDAEVTAGTNRGNMVVLLDDNGEKAEVDAAMIVRYAAGKSTATDFDNTVYFADNDSTNWDPANLTGTAPVVSDATSAVTSIANDFVIQEGDGQ